MMQIKIQLVVLLGILSKVSGDQYRFVLINEPKTWKEAQSYCRETYKDLATVQSDADRAKLKEAANAVNFQSVAWIGFYYSVFTWHWSYRNTKINYTKWESGEPDTYRTQKACATVTKDGLWHNTSCTELKYFICQTEKQDKLQDKFKYIEKTMNWSDAQMYCRSHEIDLATIKNDAENAHLAYVLSEKNDWEAWIGLCKNLSQWRWSDQTNMSWSSMKWKHSQPSNTDANEGCAIADTDGLMVGNTCLTPLPFYCREDTKTQRVRFTLKSDGHLDESAVMEAIEKKMKQITLEHNIYSTTWSVQPGGTIFQQQKTQENKDNTQETATACEDFGPVSR
ncbi:macrophage mannose receptor 1-like [Onychostoma macrolepis]|uniref:macrophage mannose receptor 1-like n=1 Tax=Onychostoma macrolepis TaxID=369639 RepID=UPI00272C02F3|nr:macrophage mannose receptor 1-like [Onychostoma macrolepis]